MPSPALPRPAGRRNHDVLVSEAVLTGFFSVFSVTDVFIVFRTFISYVLAGVGVHVFHDHCDNREGTHAPTCPPTERYVAGWRCGWLAGWLTVRLCGW